MIQSQQAKTIYHSKYVYKRKTVYNHDLKEKETIEYMNVPAAFDIETTSAMINGQKVSWMYIWMFRIFGKTYYGRTWEQFRQFLVMLIMQFGLNHNKRLIVYIHNMPFDFSFMKSEVIVDEVFATEDHKAIKTVVADCIEFKDSYILTQQSLASIGDDIGIAKLKGDLDYDLIRTPSTPMTRKELEYCDHDVIILEKKIEQLIKQEGNNITKIPMTKTGYVRREVRKMCNNKDNYRDYRRLMGILTMTEGEYNFCKLVFMGGFTHANSRFIGIEQKNVHSMDETSAYPAMILSKKFPMGPAVPVKIHSIQQYMKLYKDHCIMQTLYLKGVEVKKDAPDTYISRHKCAVAKNAILDNGRIVSADEIVISCTDQDFFIILKLYNIKQMKIENAYCYRKHYLPKPIIEAVLLFYVMKTTLKGVIGEEETYMAYKAMLNSIYGMMVTDIVMDLLEYCGETHTWEKHKAKDVPGHTKKSIEHYNESKNRVLFYPWGVWVTAYNRCAIWQAIFALGQDYRYTDTDSVKYVNYEKHQEFFETYNKQIVAEIDACLEYYGIDKEKSRPKNKKGKKCQIGVFDYEGYYKRFKTLGAKRYIVLSNHNKEGKWRFEITIAGLGKKAGADYMKKFCREKRKKEKKKGEKSSFDVFDVFDNGMYIPAEKTGKMTHTYIDEKWEGYVTDYLGNTDYIIAKSGCHLCKTDFTLTMENAWITYLMGVQKQEYS